MRAFAFVLFLLPVILLGTLACGAEEAEPAATVTPTQAAQAEATAEPEATRSDAAPATATPTEAAPTAVSTAAASPTAPTGPTEPAPEATEAPGQMYTPTPAPTEAPEPTEPPEEEPADSGAGPASFLVGEDSQITFTVEEELNRTPVRFDAVISGTGLGGYANLDGSPSVIILELHSLESDQSFRDRFIRERMFPNTPEATVTFDRLPDLPQSFFDGEETEGTLDGSLQIGDTVTPLTFDVVARLDPGVINVLGKTTFTWDELGLGKPVFGPVAYLADEVRVQVLVVAREQ